MEQKYKPYIMYKITCNHNENLIYIGSTTNFRVRKSIHKSNSNNENSKAYNCKIYENIRNNGGWDNFTMRPIEMYYSDNKIKAKIRENELMKVFNSNLNTINAYTSDEERKENDIVRNKEYYEINKEEIKKEQKKYYENNKEKKQLYYENNKEIINFKRKEKITCNCGSLVNKTDLKRHLTSKKHTKLITNST